MLGITMLTQSVGRITYTADGWRTVASGLICLAFSVLVLAPVLTSIRLDGMDTFGSLGGSLFIGTLLVAGLGLVAFAFLLIFGKSRQRDVLTITTAGLAYTHLDKTETYSWACLGELIYTPGFRSSGSYRMDVVGEGKSVRIVLDTFGSDPVEMQNVITSARRGVMADAVGLRAKTKKDSLQLILAVSPIIIILFGVVLLVMFFHR